VLVAHKGSKIPYPFESTGYSGPPAEPHGTCKKLFNEKLERFHLRMGLFRRIESRTRPTYIVVGSPSRRDPGPSAVRLFLERHHVAAFELD
jgi:hypothetical protein